jgi:hypothetical protein
MHEWRHASHFCAMNLLSYRIIRAFVYSYNIRGWRR